MDNYKLNTMKNIIKYSLFTCVSLALFMLSCSKDEEILIDNALRVLTQKIDGEAVQNGVDGISNTASIELLFTHSLNKASFEGALSLSSASGNVAYSLSYDNSDSEVTITPDMDLEYETSYTLTVSSGTHGSGGEVLDDNYSLGFTTAPFVPANVILSAEPLVLSEDGGQSVITLTLSDIVTEDVSVELGFSGSAEINNDYSADNTMVLISSGETEAFVTLTAIQDNNIEGTENIEVSIMSIQNAEELTPQLISLDILDDDIDSNGDGTPDQGFIINEVLFDPPGGDAGDANGDGTRSASQDEFIEFVNDSDQEVNLSGFTLFDATNLETMEPRHTFPDGTIIPPGGVYVLFGGGVPSTDFGNAQVAVSTSGNMNLSNSDDVITILDLDGNVFIEFDTQGEGSGIGFGEDQSVTRFEDINGAFVLHSMANPSLLYSPGKKSDGSNFDGSTSNPSAGFVINEVLFDPPGGSAGDANGDGTRSASEDEFIEFVNDTDQAVDLSGFMLFDETNLATMEPRHVFPQGTLIPARSVYVLFGGGTPSGVFGGATIATSSTGNMNLSNGGDIITILDTSGNVFLTFDTATDGMGIDFGSDQSVTRNPDLTGGFILQQDANAAFSFTPGTKNDGTNFY